MPPAVRIVTDSNADLPAALAAQHAIGVVPSLLNLDGRSYREGVDISRAEFYERLPTLKQPPTTAAPSTGDFEAAFRACGDALVVSINLASKLSAVYNAARLAAESFGGRVTVIDSASVSMGQGWQVLAAAEAATAGAGLEAVLDIVRSVQRRARLMAALDTIEYLRRSGRASSLTTLMGDLLQIKPLIEIANGEVRALGRVRTREKARDSLVAHIEALGPLERLAVVHTAALADAQALAARLAPRAAEPSVVVEATSILGAHVGPGTLGLAALTAA